MALGSIHRLVNRKPGDNNDSRTVKEIIGLNFAKCYFRDPQIFLKKSENCYKILGASRMTRHKFYIDDYQILGALLTYSMEQSPS